MSTKVKICGLTNADTALVATRYGADYLGFIHYQASPRHISLENADTLGDNICALMDRFEIAPAARPERVAVMVNPSLKDVLRFTKAVGAHIVQLHGAESAEFVRTVKAETGLKVTKSVSVEGAEDLKRSDDYLGLVDMFLFDAKPLAHHALPGGNAHAFHWPVMRSWPYRKSHPWMLAGGLKPDNVAEAIRTSGAPAVDVSSGVESSTGQKSDGLVARFIEAAKAHSQY